jgi:hypothetical protein
MNCVYVKFDGDRMPLLANDGVLDAMGLSDGQMISEGQMWEVIRLNAASLVGTIKLKKLYGEQGLPDTEDLEALIAGRKT